VGLITEGFGLDPEQLWITVHTTDDQAEEIWRDLIGVRPERIQRLGADNFWRWVRRVPAARARRSSSTRVPSSATTAAPPSGARTVTWSSGTSSSPSSTKPRRFDDELPKKNIDTGAGFERTLSILDGVESVFFTDLFAPLLETASRALNAPLGRDDQTDVAIRRIAEHGRAMTMLVSDGVLPSNEGAVTCFVGSFAERYWPRAAPDPRHR